MVQTEGLVEVARDTAAQAAPAAKAAPAAPAKAAVTDTVVLSRADSLQMLADRHPLLVVEAVEPTHRDAGEHFPLANTESWVLGAILVVIIAIMFRFRRNRRYFTGLISELTEMRERRNVFDDTVRETTFLIALNILCFFSCGLLLHAGVSHYVPEFAARPHYLDMWGCIGLTTVYGLVMPAIYGLWGYVFTTGVYRGMWLRAYGAQQAFLGVALLPSALICLAGTPDVMPALWVAIGFFIIIKILFILKSLRIFIGKFMSWVTFLYYLCSLEIVPLILTCLGAYGLSWLWRDWMIG